MSLSLVTDAGTVRIPGVVIQTKIATSAGGQATTGVMVIVGEASTGLDYASEVDLVESCSWGPDEFASVLAKYTSGPLVDAFSASTSPANDPEIQGAPSRIITVKTNAGLFASGTLPAFSGTWATLRAASPGANGNLFQRTVTSAVTEVIPTTGSFTMLVPIATTDINFRVNGGSAVPYTITAGDFPSASVAGINALAGVAATGGANRGIIASATGTIGITVVSGNAVTFTRSVAWSVTPSVGDVVFVSATSAIAGGSSQNVGSYVVTAATSTTISATKLLDASGTPNQLTSPSTVAPASIVSTTDDLRAWSPVVISLEAGNPSDGLGKSLEVAELTSSSGRLSYISYALSTSVVTWISTSAVPTDLTSATEYRPNVNISRQSDLISEDITGGGEVLLQLGYLGTTASAVIASGIMTITVTGGAGTSPAPISLAGFTTVSDLAGYLATLTGFSAAVGSPSVSTRPATDLDSGTFTLASTFGAKNGRIKGDAAKLKGLFAVSNNVRLSGTLPTSGAPAPASAAFLAGGTKGATADAAVAAALLALEGVDCNFVVPLFSNDASVDIADGLTDSGSTYSIAGVNASTRSHILKMYQLKNFSPRQGMLSFRGTFAQAKAAGSNTAAYQCSMSFEDVRVASTTGSVVQQRPWMGAVLAAAMQAAAFRKSIFNKGVNIVGALQAAGDYNPRTPSQVEDALIAGLLPLGPLPAGGWQFVSDQTTYTQDGNFFFNSIQAVYGGNLIARILQSDLRVVVGQSIADLNRAQALTLLRNSLTSIRDLKLITTSDDAQLGYKNENAVLTPPSALFSVEVREATSLYFVRILLSIGPVVQGG